MLQRIINLVYRYPASRLKTYKRFGGYFKYRSVIRNSRLMAEASMQLPPILSHPEGLPLYFLTGKNYLYQTLFCIQSLARVSSTRFRFILVDDGSFDETLMQQVNKSLPGAEVVTQTQIAENLQNALPQDRYPFLHHKREVYPHIKKLTDIHTIPGNSWKLVLDSDMLFWHSPVEMIKWLKSPEGPLNMLDCTPSYGYSTVLMELLCGEQIQPMLNVGAIGLNSNAINWDNLEHWGKTLEEKEGASYYLEQALSAMLIGNKPATILNATDYIVNPEEAAVKNRVGVLHHYVDLSKAAYFNIAWKKLTD
ncbi:glycosyltransferase family A protein [Mucilaginibacter pedocola]|uniref:Glycosyl transferase n=1 Tax=Mucilaginibacter pedocola TaxID=1792845 RepID=A0A1S9PAX4_9SPHI|nr:glycosyltransferase family A protein [Mucilaginibacter pedocola]OOQ58079.1 hypothetical protein BC343_10495 [Mucilaginibacter pedocola]